MPPKQRLGVVDIVYISVVEGHGDTTGRNTAGLDSMH